MSDDDPYLYPGRDVLRNRLGILREDALERIERQISSQRATEGVPSGDFDLKHLRAVHHHLFQDIYDWAGEVRTVEISKDGHQFQFRRFIEAGMSDVHRRVVAERYLAGLRASVFAEKAAAILGDVNYVHPFRDGNGRTQLQYLRQLAERAGHPIDLTRLDRERWLAASRASHLGDYARMAQEIGRIADAPI